jgi:hypothetical protein
MRVIVVKGAEMRAACTPKEEHTLDASVNFKSLRAVKGRSGGWIAGVHILGTVLLAVCSSLPSRRPCFLLFQNPFSPIMSMHTKASKRKRE